MQGFLHLFLRSGRIGEQEIVPDGTAHEAVALGHITEIAPRGRADGNAAITGIQHYGAAGRMQERKYETRKGTLAGTGHTHNRRDARRLEIIGEMLQDQLGSNSFRYIGIGKADILEADAGGVGEHDVLPRRLERKVGQLEDTLHGSK